MRRKTLKRRRARRRTAKKRGGAKKYYKKFGTHYYETDVVGKKITPEIDLGEIAPVGKQWDNVDHIERMGIPEGVDD